MPARSRSESSMLMSSPEMRVLLSRIVSPLTIAIGESGYFAPSERGRRKFHMRLIVPYTKKGLDTNLLTTLAKVRSKRLTIARNPLGEDSAAG